MNDRRDHSGAGQDASGHARRRLMKSLAATGGIFATAKLLPDSWTRPVVDSVTLPAHAQSSPGETPSLVTGAFTTGVLGRNDDSILDLVVPTAHALIVGSVSVGNATFDVSWDVDENGYAICGNGQVLTPNASYEFFTIDGSGGRSGDMLNRYQQSIPFGILEIVNQAVQSSQLTFDCRFQSDSTNGVVAPPGGGCGQLNVQAATRISSPYPDEDLA